MDAASRLERTLETAISPPASPTGRNGVNGPPRLSAAIHHAMFPGGARVRPRLCLAVARACGDGEAELAYGAAAALEMIHCASLVHDDLPCFDDAPMRRGAPSVHQAFGESLAVLTGDALIVLAFETLARSATGPAACRLGPLVLLLSRATGLPRGIIAGQAWECEPGSGEAQISLAAYHRAKTGALFAAATMAGALAAGQDAASWSLLGERLGEAYQVADDIRDVVATPMQLGKPVGRDQALGRPSAAIQHGVGGAMLRLGALVGEAIAAIPACPLSGELAYLIGLEVQRLLPGEMLLNAA